MESRRPINLITRPQKRKQNHILNQILNETLTPQNRRKMGQSKNLVKKGCSMVVPMNPCRRRGGLWWRMEVGRGGKIGPTRWASPVRPKLGSGWAIKLLARKKSGQIWPGPPEFILALKRLFGPTGPVFRTGWAVKILARKNQANFGRARFWPSPLLAGPGPAHCWPGPAHCWPGPARPARLPPLEVGSGGEENRGKGEKKGKWRRKARKGERKGKESGFFKFNSRRWECRPMDKINNRRWDCRPLNICLIAGVVNAGFCHLFPNALVWLYF